MKTETSPAGSHALAERINDPSRAAIVEFHAPWCGPCKQMEPILNELSEAHASEVETIRVNADEDSTIVAQMRIFSIPTIVVMKNGAEIARRVGAQSRDALDELYRSAASGAPIAAVSNRARIFRIAVAAAIMLASTEARVQWPFYIAAGGVFFSAIHDRCPIWQAIKRVFRPEATEETIS